MRKIFLSIVVVVVSAATAHAQTDAANAQQKKQTKKFTYNVGVDVGLPVDYVSEYSSVAYGGSLQAEYPVLDKLGVTASAHFLEFIAKRGGKSVTFIPLLGGVKYYLKPNIYASGQAGMSFYGGRDKGDGVGGSGERYFTYIGGIGFRTSKHFDILLKYETVYIESAARPYSFAGVRIGYNFSLK